MPASLGSTLNSLVSTLKTKNAHSRSKFISFTEDPFSEGVRCTGKKLQKLSLLLNMADTFLLFFQTILDMTFGAGGHSKALLHSLPDCKILALDRDPYAYKLAQELASER